MRLGDLIDPFAEAEGPPPQTLGRFFLWALGGSMPVLIVAAIASCVAGTLEVITAMLLGTVIDAALNTGPDQFFFSCTLARKKAPARKSRRIESIPHLLSPLSRVISPISMGPVIAANFPETL